MEGMFESPRINEESIPQQLKGVIGQATNSIQQLPVPIRDVVTGGLKVPLGENFSALIHVLYSK